jgi:hypothetical protein
MPTVLVTYNVSQVVVGTGLAPGDPATPIADPDDCGLRTNQRLPFAAGVHCFTLMTTDNFAPLWVTRELIEGQDETIPFRQVP